MNEALVLRIRSMPRAERLALYRALVVVKLGLGNVPIAVGTWNPAVYVAAEVSLATVALHYAGTREGAADMLDRVAARSVGSYAKSRRHTRALVDVALRGEAACRPCISLALERVSRCLLPRPLAFAGQVFVKTRVRIHDRCEASRYVPVHTLPNIAKWLRRRSRCATKLGDAGPN
jgi:hypothetical protein